MPNFKTHVITGILFFPTFFLLYSFFMDIFNISFNPNTNMIIISFFFFVLGADLPDVDHNFSLINKFFRILLVGLGIYIVFKIKQSYDILSFLQIRLYIINTIYIILGILIGGLIGALFNYVTKHRGKWHSPITAIIFGVIAYYLNTNNYYQIDFYSLYLGLSITTGYIIHLFLDYHFKS
jgi:inner membrane protein